MKLDPTINLGDMLVAAALAASGLIAFANLSARVDVHDERIAAIGTGTNSVHAELVNHMQQEVQERDQMRAEIREDLAEIKLRLDRIIEREIGERRK